MGIFKFTKGIKILENSSVRPPCGRVNGHRIISVLESQAYLTRKSSDSKMDALKLQNGKPLQIGSESEGE